MRRSVCVMPEGRFNLFQNSFICFVMSCVSNVPITGWMTHGNKPSVLHQQPEAEACFGV